MKKAICAITKNELDLECWLDYYLTIGFDKIFLYDDNNIKKIPSSEKIKVFDRINCKYRNNPTIHCMFADFILKEYKNFNWIGNFDCDEYLVFDKDLNSILYDFQEFSSICVNWLCFGSSGYEMKPSGRVFDNYILRAKYFSNHIKSIINTKYYTRIFNSHYILGSKPNVKPNGEKIETNSKYIMGYGEQDPNYKICENIMWLNHYILKSKENWLKKEKKIEDFIRLDKYLNVEKDLRCRNLYYRHRLINSY